ncbi:MAG TPA: prepilin-type N-terminal cleavage/methylation domain-containing protein [Candidatus Polarisedimenticolia bacterium]|nr:prepilin-type N-terminal cleavage/methylation domain-containing protein [Candidatus Polarisedimenticolia bacterium]
MKRKKRGIMESGRRTARQAGYSLPELLAVIAIMGIIVVFGGPALQTALRAYRVRSMADMLTTDIRALRYDAVTNRATRTMTVNDRNASPANQYSFTNSKGKPVTIHMEQDVDIDTTSDSSISFGINGATGSTSSLSVSISGQVNTTRGDRYTITVTPTGTVSAAYTQYTP